MALTEIARKLKETFNGFDVQGFQEELNKFRDLYNDAESIRIGEMDYIVINDVYKNEEYSDIPESTSPLFYNSINNNYAILDAENSSTLIDEVYSRITYMQRDCESGARLPSSDEIKNTLRNIIGNGESIISSQIEAEEDGESSLSRNKANIFQCQLIKDTGVSAAPDTYSFMLKDGKIKEVADSALKMIKDSGTLRMLDDSNFEELKASETSIQEAVFNKYINSDIDIQSVTVKSIFEIKMAYCKIYLILQSQLGNEKIRSVFNTSYLASENNEFEALNANIHICNCCKHDLVDVRDEHKIYKLHANLDAYDEKHTEEAIKNAKKTVSRESILDHIVYATGCEDCLVKCEKCGSYHFDYQKLAGSKIFDNVALAPGRSFIKNIREFNINYCQCREGIEWVYDECSGSADEHDVIPIEDMVFLNYANEKLKDYKDFKEFYDSRKRDKNRSAIEEKEDARRAISKFKTQLANEFNISVSSIKVSSVKKCNECCICGGLYYGRLKDDRCAICNELFDENRSMVTRVDGIVFMVSKSKNTKTIRRYVVTKLGNLKLIGTPKTIGQDASGEPEIIEEKSETNEAIETSVSVSEPAPKVEKEEKNPPPAQSKPAPQQGNNPAQGAQNNQGGSSSKSKGKKK